MRHKPGADCLRHIPVLPVRSAVRSRQRLGLDLAQPPRSPGLRSQLPAATYCRASASCRLLAVWVQQDISEAAPFLGEDPASALCLLQPGDLPQPALFRSWNARAALRLEKWPRSAPFC